MVLHVTFLICIAHVHMLRAPEWENFCLQQDRYLHLSGQMFAICLLLLWEYLLQMANIIHQYTEQDTHSS